MDYLKAYAHQVVSYHPEGARDELFAELYNELCEEYADWLEENPGRDEEAFLDANKDHPMRFATRLAPEGSAYLIGPQFYYSFISALKIATLVTFGFHLIFGVISALASGAYLSAITRASISALGNLVWVVASITGVFIALERSGERATWLDNWKASKLAAIGSHQAISKSETFFDLGISLVALLWLLEIIGFPMVVRLDGTWISGWTTNLPDVFWVIAGIMLVLDIAYCVFKLVRNFWSTRLRLLSIAFNVSWMAMLGYAAANIQLIAPGEFETGRLQELQGLINMGVHGILYIIVVVLLIDTLSHGWKLYKPGDRGLFGRSRRVETEGLVNEE